MIAALERGLDYTAISKMTVGQVVDFCIEYNNRQNQEEKPHKATQEEINAYFGT